MDNEQDLENLTESIEEEGQEIAVGEAIETTSALCSKRRSFTLEFKLAAIKAAKKSNISKVARTLSINQQTLSTWVHKSEQLQAEFDAKRKTKKRLSGGGRKPAHEELEQELFEWLQSQRNAKMPVTRKMLRIEAIQIALRNVIDFAASNGWLDNFMRRRSLSLRRTTSVCQKMPENLVPKIISFILYVQSKREEHKYPLTAIFGAGLQFITHISKIRCDYLYCSV